MRAVRFHRRQTIDAAPAQQSHEDGLGLVIGCVARHDIGWQHGSAGVARSCFEVSAAGERRAMQHERHADLLGELGCPIGFG